MGLFHEAEAKTRRVTLEVIIKTEKARMITDNQLCLCQCSWSWTVPHGRHLPLCSCERSKEERRVGVMYLRKSTAMLKCRADWDRRKKNTLKLSDTSKENFIT